MTEFIDGIRRGYFNDCPLIPTQNLTEKLKKFVQSTGMEVRKLGQGDHNDYVFILGEKYVGLARVNLTHGALVEWLKEEFQI